MQGLQALQGEVEAWVQMIDVGPWTSQKCASEIWRVTLAVILTTPGRRVPARSGPAAAATLVGRRTGHGRVDLP